MLMLRTIVPAQVLVLNDTTSCTRVEDDGKKADPIGLVISYNFQDLECFPAQYPSVVC